MAVAVVVDVPSALQLDGVLRERSTLRSLSRRLGLASSRLRDLVELVSVDAADRVCHDELRSVRGERIFRGFGREG